MMWASDIVPRRLERILASHLLRPLKTEFVEEIFGLIGQAGLWTFGTPQKYDDEECFVSIDFLMSDGRFLFMIPLKFLMRDGVDLC